MLFKRSVPLPNNSNLQMLLEKWNPGVGGDALQDMMGAVCRWNRLKDSTSAQAGQVLLIPTVIPHGQEPGMGPPQKRSPTTPMMPVQMNRPPGQAMPPAAPPRPALGVPTSPLWAAGSQPGRNFAGEHVKQQFQKVPWNRTQPDGGAWG